MRLHGRACHFDKIAELGECVMWYVPAKRRTKLEPRWRSGVFLGRSRNTDANFIGLADGSVTTARAMVRVAESERWVADTLFAITGVPMSRGAVNFDVVEGAVDPHRGPRATVKTALMMTAPPGACPSSRVVSSSMVTPRNAAVVPNIRWATMPKHGR